VVVGPREEVQDRLYAMDTPEREFDATTARVLAKIAARREKLETSSEKIEDDPAHLERLQRRHDALEAQEQEIIEKAPIHFSEETKARATSFLILDPDGRVHREYRVARRRHERYSTASESADESGAIDSPKAPTSDELSDKQLAATFTHEALAVREALLKNPVACKRILVMILHEKIRSEALSVRRDANGTTLHASSPEFISAAFDRLNEKRAKLDPFNTEHFVEDAAGYETLGTLSAAKLDALIDLLIVETITAHPLRPTALVRHLAEELKINLRDHWRPDAAWLSSFQKIQLAHLIVELKGAVNAPSPETKKSALIEALAKLFAEAAEGKLDDRPLADQVNAWLPFNLRAMKEATIEPRRRSKKES
jgi:hypothetical protein